MWQPLKTILAIIGGGIMVILGHAVAILTVIALAMETVWISDQIQSRVEKNWNREVHWSGGIEVDWAMAPTLTIKRPTLANASWAEEAHIASAESISARINLRPLLNQKLVVERLTLDKPRIHLQRSPDKGSNWQALISEKDEPPFFQTRFEEIEISDGKLNYVASEEETDIAMEVDTTQGQKLRFNGKGSFKGKSLAFDLTGDPPRKVTAALLENRTQPGAYALRGNLDWGEHQLTLDGQSDTLTSLQSLEFQFSLQGPNSTEITRLFGYETRDAAYRVEGVMQRRDTKWRLENLDGNFANNEFKGEVTWIEGQERPNLNVAFNIEALNLDKTLPGLMPSDREEFADEKTETENGMRWKSLVKTQTAKLKQLDFDLDLQAQQLILKGRQLHNIDLRAHLASGRLEIGNLSGKLGEGSFTVVGSVDGSQPLPQGSIDIELTKMDMGRVLPTVEVTQLGYLEGTVSASMKDETLLLEKSRLRYWHDNMNNDIDIRLASQTMESSGVGIQLTASGILRNHPFNLELNGGPLLDLDDPHKPYPLSLNSTFDETIIQANGTITQPMLLNSVDLKVHVEGPDPAQLWYITPFILPHLPPYSIDARLKRDEEKFWVLREIDGTVGNSDLSGTVRWRATLGERPEVWANLNSRLLDLDDLLPVIGAAPATGRGEATSPALEALARRQEAREEILPTAGLMRERLKAVDAHVDFKALEMRARKVPFEEVVLELDLEDGILKGHPLALHFAKGKFTLNGEINANFDPARSNGRLEISRVNLKEFTEHFNIAADTKGIFGGDGKLTMEGNSPDQALASIDGSLQLLMSDGQINALLVEAAGLDLGEVLLSLGEEQPEPLEILCLYAKLEASKGQANVEALTMATSDSNIVGKGEIDFANETYELVLEARPKDFSVLSSSSPVRVYGNFANYNVDMVSDELIARGALALLGAMIFPPAALLPLVEPGTASGQAGCQQLVSSSKKESSK
ncbi:hypothetical protein CWI75_16705 [Kineobactrum sediminis]|uniref:AsmA domain-containing protein n=1 Tax=Kineobactrum sediminis TaxID=1905677 RepID=A0A2N5XYP8_9GAMM|nr:hypothetical protein CWI75_16705 [Kineobactrum sediminis]